MLLVHKWIATSLGTGYLPVAPGTWGSIFGIIVLFFLQYFSCLSQELLVALIIFFFFIGTWSTHVLEKEWGKDPSRVVIDETVGVWVNIVFLPFQWQIWLIGLILFRVLDIWKPLGIRRLENVKGAWGVMLDDLAAGIIGNVILQVMYFSFLKNLLS